MDKSSKSYSSWRTIPAKFASPWFHQIYTKEFRQLLHLQVSWRPHPTEEVVQRYYTISVFPNHIGSLPNYVDKKRVDGYLQVHLLEPDMLFTADFQPFGQRHITLVVLTADVSQ